MSTLRAAIVVFARQPVAGRVKTRLATEIGADEACRVYRELLAGTLHAAAAVNARRFLFLPEGDHLQPWEFAVESFETRVQVGEDLGQRMDGAFRALFAEGLERVVLIGSDCPYLSAAILGDALAALKRSDTVFVPALDGGYALVGQRSPARDLFGGIPWSTPEVWRLTRERIAAGGWSCAVLPSVEDIDDAGALARWRKARLPARP